MDVRQYKMGDVGEKFRNKHGKIRKWPADKGDSKLAYLQELVVKMIAADVGREAPAATPLPTNLVRRPHTIAPQFTTALSKKVKKEQLERVQLESAPKDDPVGVPLLAKYKQKIFFENDVPLKEQGTYQILDVRYLEKRSEWVTCSAPVEKNGDGHWVIPAKHLVKGGSGSHAVVHSKSYEYHVLADVSDPANILYGDCVDNYVQAHEAREATQGNVSKSHSAATAGRKRKR